MLKKIDACHRLHDQFTKSSGTYLLLPGLVIGLKYEHGIPIWKINFLNFEINYVEKLMRCMSSFAWLI